MQGNIHSVNWYTRGAHVVSELVYILYIKAVESRLLALLRHALHAALQERPAFQVDRYRAVAGHVMFKTQDNFMLVHMHLSKSSNIIIIPVSPFSLPLMFRVYSSVRSKHPPLIAIARAPA